MKRINLKAVKQLLLAGLLSCGLLLPTLAGATPVRFNIDGQFASPAAGAFTGTMDVDTDLGQILAINVLFPGISPFDVLKVSIAQVAHKWRIRVDNASRDVLQIIFTTPDVSGQIGSLVGFDGGVVFSGTASGPGIRPNLTNFSGSITPMSVSVPEPAALGLFGLGLSLICLLAMRRRRRAC